MKGATSVTWEEHPHKCTNLKAYQKGGTRIIEDEEQLI